MKTLVDTILTTGGPNSSEWVPLNYLAKWFGATVFVSLDTNAVLTSYSVQRTYDDFSAASAITPTSVTRSTTTVTVVDPLHGLVTGDAIKVHGNGDTNIDGFHDVTVTDLNTYTYTALNSGLTAGGVGTKINRFRVIVDANMTAKTAKADAAIATPVTGVRLIVVALSAGSVRMRVIQGHGG